MYIVCQISNEICMFCDVRTYWSVNSAYAGRTSIIYLYCVFSKVDLSRTQATCIMYCISWLRIVKHRLKLYAAKIKDISSELWCWWSYIICEPFYAMRKAVPVSDQATILVTWLLHPAVVNINIHIAFILVAICHQSICHRHVQIFTR